jgi:hypothetical protein
VTRFLPLRSLSGVTYTDHGSPTVLSREAVANTSPSLLHEQSQIIRAWDLSAATGTYPIYTSHENHLNQLWPMSNIPSSLFSNDLHVRSRLTVTIKLSSGLKAMRVTVRECPSSGEPNGWYVDVEYTRTTACCAEVALQAVANKS